MPCRADRPARKAGRRPQTCRAKSQICAHAGCRAPTHRRPVLPPKKGSAPPNGAKSLPMVRFSPSIDTLYYRIHDYAFFVNRPHCNIARLSTFLLARPRAGPLFARRPPPCRRGGPPYRPRPFSKTVQSARPCKTSAGKSFPHTVAAVPRALFPRPQKETAPSQTEGAVQKRSGGKNRELFPVLHEDRANEMSWAPRRESALMLPSTVFLGWAHCCAPGPLSLSPRLAAYPPGST